MENRPNRQKTILRSVAHCFLFLGDVYHQPYGIKIYGSGSGVTILIPAAHFLFKLAKISIAFITPNFAANK